MESASILQGIAEVAKG